MSLSIVRTNQEQLVCQEVVSALRNGIERTGSVVLLVPSFAQALQAQRTLAGIAGLALSVTTTTPSAWLAERWEVWGDGRAIADGTVLGVVAHQVLAEASEEELGTIRLSAGVIEVLVALVGQALPWLPLDVQGMVDEGACLRAGLTAAETRLVGLAGKVGQRLCERGYVTEAEVAHLIPTTLRDAEVVQQDIVLVGFGSMRRAQRELVGALADSASVTMVAPVNQGPASQQLEQLLAWFEPAMHQEAHPLEGPADAPRADALRALLEVLFTGEPLQDDVSGAVELLLPAGPASEAELVARCVTTLAREDKVDSLAVVVPDMKRARRELVPKLAARGLSVRLAVATPLLESAAAQAFFSFARMVAQLADLNATWPEPVAGIDGMMAQLGDMSWWPPRELTDFLLSEIAHVGAERAWWDDATWRGNRLLTPARLLAALQSERDTSAPVARATTELLKGRVGTAASKLLQPYVEALGQPGSTDNAGAGDAMGALQAILQVAGTLRELGVTADQSVKGAVTLTELVDLAQWAAGQVAIMERMHTEGDADSPLITLMGVGTAAQLPPASVDALVLCGLTTAEQPVGAGDDLLQALLERLDIEPPADPMAQARASFRGVVAAVREHLVLERVLHDADSKVTYPSVMLSELLAACGISASAGYDAITLSKQTLPETLLGDNLSSTGRRPTAFGACEPAPSGQLTEASRGLVFVPQEGSDLLSDAKPVLSASQVETYLDCPYKWFSLRRLRLGTVDAGHGGMEMGTFAHRVLEVTHRELLARALEAQHPGVSREELLAAIEANPACSVAGSRVSEVNLDVARDVLSDEFTLHQQHMYMVKRPRLAQQLLVAHGSAERAQEDQLREDLLSSLAYQTRILQSFEPRLFEWSFGRHGEVVEYAGAYFTGTVDRIDVSPHGTAVIIDYKHKSPAGFAAEYDALQDGVLEGDTLPNRVQSLIYAQVVRRAFEGRLRLVGSVYLSTKSPHALAGVADENVADLVFGRVSSQRAPRVSVPRAGGESGMNALLDRTEELVAEQVHQMLAGNVEARPRDAHSCDFCPVMQCERRVAR